MKKILFVAMVALAAFACKEPNEEIVIPEPDKGVTYLLEGVIDTEGFEWSESAIIGLYSMNTAVKANNLECKIEGYVAPVVPGEGDEEGGENEGGEENVTPAMFLAGEAVPANAKRFVTPAMDLVKGENEFMVYYPYDKGLTYVMGTIYGLNVSASQVQTLPNVAAECFSLGTAKGTPKVDETFKFVMNPITALAQVKITSSEFADYGVKKVTIWNNDDVTLSGGFNVNVNDMTFENLPNATPTRAAVTVNAPKLFSAVSTQNIYINLLPSDLTGKDMWLLVELEGPKGGVTLPIKKAGVKFEAGKTTVIELSNLSLADNAAGEWYVPNETRLLGGLGYAYGEANTYLIQCKNGTTYNGATYTPNADIPNQVKIDIRPRGNFAEVVDPKGATFEWFHLGVQTNGYNGSRAIYVGKNTGYPDGSNPGAAGAWDVAYDGNYTVTVTNNTATAGAPILLMIKDNKVLWAWYFWNISADGTQLEGVDVGNGTKLANMIIGQNTTQYATWGANKDTNNRPNPTFRYAAWYQWGRYVPSAFWSSYWTIDDGVNEKSNDKANLVAGGTPVVCSGPVPLKNAIERPVGIIMNPKTYPNGVIEGSTTVDYSSPTITNWTTDVYGDLWGNDANGTGKTDLVGIKSIYDPCPKGWRVADAATLKYVVDNIALARYLEDTEAEYIGAPGILYKERLLFMTAGYTAAASSKENGRLASMGGAQTATNKTCSYGAEWTNLTPGATGHQPYSFSIYSINRQSAGDPMFKIATYNRTQTMPVRCQVDTDNR